MRRKKITSATEILRSSLFVLTKLLLFHIYPFVKFFFYNNSIKNKERLCEAAALLLLLLGSRRIDPSAKVASLNRGNNSFAHFFLVLLSCSAVPPFLFSFRLKTINNGLSILSFPYSPARQYCLLRSIPPS